VELQFYQMFWSRALLAPQLDLRETLGGSHAVCDVNMRTVTTNAAGAPRGGVFEQLFEQPNEPRLARELSQLEAGIHSCCV
jgi:hypothetical protein